MERTRNRLSNWFPLVESILPVGWYPNTRVVNTDVDLVGLLDGNAPDGLSLFTAALDAAADDLGGFPVFLRSGLMSGKHAWFASSFVTNAEMLTMSVSSIVEELVLNIPFGDYAIDEWAVREVIPFEPLMFKHNGHPIGREVRIVIADDTGVVFPYWPIDSLAGAKSTDGRELSLRDKAALLGAALRQTQDSDMAELAEWSQRIVRELGGAWSVDWLWCDAVRGWVLIDMALAAESWKPDAQDYGAWDECRRLAAEQEV